jgi:hypothetical protein
MLWNIHFMSSLQWLVMFTNRGRCYDHNFLRFLTIFCEKRRFSQKSMLWSNFCVCNLALFWVKNANSFGENIFKMKTSFPGNDIAPKLICFRQIVFYCRSNHDTNFLCLPCVHRARCGVALRWRHSRVRRDVAHRCRHSRVPLWMGGDRPVLVSIKA